MNDTISLFLNHHFSRWRVYLHSSTSLSENLSNIFKFEESYHRSDAIFFKEVFQVHEKITWA